MSKYYIADLHFGHGNVIRFDGRPYNTVREMDEDLIKRWNNVITDADEVYILGDLSWYKGDETLDILDRLNGIKYLIKGNHDRVSPQMARKFRNIMDYCELNDNGQRVILSHYPMMMWNGQFRDSVHLYGHVHNTQDWYDIQKWRIQHVAERHIPMRMYNVGCMMDYMDYTPKTLSQILSANA